MALRISDFTTAAMKGDDAVIEIKEQNQIKSSGFFGRIFGSAGKNAETNQATLKAFVDSIRREKGDLLADHVKAKFSGLVDSGQPLSGRVVKAIMHETKLMQSEVKRLNEHYFQRLIYDEGPNGLKALVAHSLPQGSQLGPKHLDVLASLVQISMRDLTEKNILMGPEHVHEALQPYKANLASLTPEALARLNAFVDNHQQHNLTRDQAETLRNHMLIHGVTSELAITKTVELFNEVTVLLPQLASCKEGSDLTQIYEKIHKKIHTLFPLPHDGSSPFSCEFPAAIQAALKTADYTPDQITVLLTNVISGRPGSEFCCSCGAARSESEHSETILRPLLDIHQALQRDLTRMVSNSVIEVEGSRATIMDSYDRLGDIPQNTARYFRAMGVALPASVYASPLQHYESLLQFVAGMGTVSTEDLYRLLQSGGSEANRGNFCDVGLGAMFSVLPELKEAEPGPGPFSPQNVWQKVFNEPLPEGVTSDNLSASIGAAIAKRLNDQFGRDVAGMKGPNVFIAISSMGVPWRRAFDLLGTPGEMRISDFPNPPVVHKLFTSPTWELERETLDHVTRDTCRREGRPTITIGEHAPIFLKHPVPSEEEMEKAMAPMNEEQKAEYLERVKQLRNYNRQSTDLSVYNFVADAILVQLTELTGTGEETRAQRIGVLESLSQTTSNLFRFLSPLAGSTIQGAVLYEHSEFNTTVIREGECIKLRLETPLNAPMRGLLEFTVDRGGNSKLTDLRIGTSQE